MKICASCDNQLEGPQFRHYCPTCRPKVLKIQNEVARQMARFSYAPATDFKCVDCGARATGYDHRYYSMPMEVEPVCRTCNILRGPALDIRELVNPVAEQPKPEIGGREWTDSGPQVTDLQGWLDDQERFVIRRALEAAKWNATKASKALGITFRSIRYRMERLGLK